MNQPKDFFRMKFRKRGKIETVVICISIITFAIILFQILYTSQELWLKYRSVKEEAEEFGDISTTDFMFRQKIFHKTDLLYLSYRKKLPVIKPFIGEKLVHIDLKGAPPFVSFFKEFFPFIKTLGATGLLIEYEDMFPYEDDLQELKADNAYSMSEISEILKIAEENSLTVVPLVQTFGHFEFVLKHEKYKSFREVPNIPQAVCPTQENATQLIYKMIDQLVKAHPKINYIHLGCDEVSVIGKCDLCLQALSQNNWGKEQLYLNHIRKVAVQVLKTYPNIRPIIWADMVSSIKENLLREFDIDNFVDVMLWSYSSNVTDGISDKLLQTFSRSFKNVWIASAFKGATGPSQILTDARYHLTNHMSWMDIVSRWSEQINFKGIAITGWQRYDHFSLLCELLPVGIPSLAINLLYLKGIEKEFQVNKILKILNCNSRIAFSPNETKFVYKPNCNFPGSATFESINKFHILAENINSPFPSIGNGWFSFYNIVYKFSSPAHVDWFFKLWPVEQYKNELKLLEADIVKALSEIYDKHTVNEWVLTNIVPFKVRLNAIFMAKEMLLEQNIWPKRPFPNVSEAVEKALNNFCDSNSLLGCGLLI